ncbi:hypothetical protein WA026_001893 [Henosepilachna vigintioctopunctata]|uniref:Uncharacterized protein n=1 Tax=Henosepilachna vigintioctopunctata TaxID=420089 RepID=A0AAW1UJC4_9CUCU
MLPNEIQNYREKVNIISNVLLVHEKKAENNITLYKKLSEDNTQVQNQNDCDRSIADASTNSKKSDVSSTDKFDQNISTDDEIIPIALMTVAEEKFSSNILPHGSVKRMHARPVTNIVHFLNVPSFYLLMNPAKFTKIMTLWKVNGHTFWQFYHPVGVFSTSRDYNHMGRITKHLKELERKIAKRDWLHMQPSQSRETIIERTGSLLIQEGNLQNI